MQGSLDNLTPENGDLWDQPSEPSSPPEYPHPAPGPPPSSYWLTTKSPVCYFPVTLKGEVIGYAWAAVTDDAAGYVRRLGVQENVVAARSAIVWSKRFSASYNERLPAREALRRWADKPEDPVGGAIATEDEREMPSQDDLDEFASPGHAKIHVPQSAQYLPDGTPFDRSKGWGPLSPFTLENPGYDLLTDSAIRYFEVYRGDLLLGYLWAAETDDAAAFVKRVAARGDGSFAEPAWLDRLDHQCKQEQLPPLEAVRSWIGAPEDPHAGAIPANAHEHTAPSLKALQEIARKR